jgi:NAD(P)-dependent dehydrogenase (short-subunit alcohol dehydrogenase family)
MLFEITGLVIWLTIILLALGKVVRTIRERAKVPMKGRWVVITGCDSGIGLGTVEQLAAQGAHVIACTYTPEGAARAMQAGAKHSLRFDITDENAVQDAVKQIVEITGGNLWALVHNAGMVQPGFVEYQAMETYQRVMDVNFFAVVRLTQPFIAMLKQAQGRVVIVSSVDGIVSLPGNAPYDASKYAVEAYADALRVELSFWNVHVAVVNPATMRTPLALNFFEAHKTAWDMMEQRDPNGAWKNAWSREWLEEYVAVNSKNLAGIAQDPIHAIRDVAHGVTAKHPRMRYLSGTLAKTLFRALWKMPEEWSFVVKKGTVTPLSKTYANLYIADCCLVPASMSVA